MKKPEYPHLRRTFLRFSIFVVGSLAMMSEVTAQGASDQSEVKPWGSSQAITSDDVHWQASGTASSSLAVDPLPKATVSYIIFTDGTTVYALNGDSGRIEFSGTNASQVISDTFDSERKVLIRRGLYRLSSPLDLADPSPPSNFRMQGFTLELEPGTILEVPSGYDSHVFGLQERTRGVRITGGIIREAWPQQRQWQAVRLAASEGIWFNTFDHIQIWDPDVAIKLLIESDHGWINGNAFESLRIHRPNTYIDFEMNVPFVAGQNGFNRNRFENILGQSASNTVFGAKNVRHWGNTFLDVKFWDLPETAISTNIHEDAADTLILGGLMTYPTTPIGPVFPNFDFDDGLRTQIIDPWSSFLSLFKLRVQLLRVENWHGQHFFEAKGETGQVYIGTGGAQTGQALTVNGDMSAHNYNTHSSIRWKRDVADLDNALATIRRLRGVRYVWDETGSDEIGLIAEEVAKVLPELVSFEEDGATPIGVDYSRMAAVLIEAVKEQQNQIEQLKNQIHELEAQGT